MPDNQGTAKVVLNSANASLLDDPAACEEMAAQMYATLSSVPMQQQDTQSGQQIGAAALYQGSGGTAKCSTVGNSTYVPAQSPVSTAYFVAASGRLNSLNVSNDLSAPVPGALEPSVAAGIGAFASRRAQVAVIPRDGENLYVGTAGSPSSQHSALHGPLKSLSSPSWDGTGTLWVVDSDPASASQVVALTGDGATQIPVTLSGLPSGATVAGLRVAEDGARIALIIDEGGQSRVYVGWVERSGTSTDPG
ncbi:hypothetical protein GXW82_27395 [Streptacidiphilus sp. 4-A2]|nr:hypothetical protein [Streptacidiphilus sp. 4-A2]